MLMAKTKFALFFVIMMLVLSPTWAQGADILFISAIDDATAEGDEGLTTFIEAMGHTVTVFDDDEDEATTEEASAAADLVVISESVGSAKIRNEITEIETPMVVMEPWGWDEMGLTLGGGAGLEVVTPDVDIVNPGHPLAAGFTGMVPVLTGLTSVRGASRFGMGIAGDEASVVARATLSDGVTYDVLFVYEKGATLPVPPTDGSPRFAADIRVCFGFDELSYLVWNENAFALFEAAINFGLGIRIQPQPYSPSPANGKAEVAREVLLAWQPGIYAETHNVYFGTDFNDVNEATAGDPRGVLVGADQAETTFDVGQLDFGQSYYWRVDEVNAAPDATVYRGDVWNFEIANFLIVDDFETYDDFEPNRVFDTWVDGWLTSDNGALVGYAEPDFDAGEHFVETSTVHTGKQSMPLFFDTDMKFSEAVMALSGSASDWTREGVQSLSLWFKGFPAVVSSFAEEAGGVFRMVATGTDIWANADEFHFAYREITGATTIIARVDSMDTGDGWVKTGVMIRDTLDANSRNLGMFLTPENGLRFQFRNAVDGATDREFDPNLVTPYWVRLERTSGGLVRAYRSPDGADWTRFPLRQIAMSNPIYVGLAVTSHDPDITAEGVLSHVTMTGNGSDAPWMHQDVGLTTNPAESLFVSVNGGAAVFHPDPAATQLEPWTQWIIPLQTFVDQGVSLSSVNALTLGVGAQGDTSSPGGQGQLFIDDVRLNLE